MGNRMDAKSETIDPKTFRKGDRVWVEGTILDVGVEHMRVELDHPERTSWLFVGSVRRHFPSPRPIEVGDRVRLGAANLFVRSIFEGWAWVASTRDSPGASVHLASLELVES